ncbi:MAG: leucine-rich repeat protein [Bacteroidales bacterium]|nr:leucine-rich repeat protein [Bacteroidales bacterium]
MKKITTFLVFALVFAFAIVPSQTAIAQLQINGTGNFTTVADFQTAITSALASGDVTVTGELTGATESLTLSIPANRRVVWEAEYTSEASVVIRGVGPVATIAPAGTFEIVAGGKIQNTVDMFGVAISIQSRGTTVIVSGGEVVSSGGIFPVGIVVGTGSEQQVIITDGVVSGSHHSIDITNDAVVFISGNPTITGTISTGNGVAITYTGAGGTYDAGTNENLTIQPNTATAVWAIENGVSGVSFARGANTGFIAVDGVTVTGAVPQTWDIGSPIATSVTATLHNDTLTISGFGPTQNFNNTTNRSPWFNVVANIEKVIINNGVTSIGESMFFEHANLTSITIPNTVSTIGAFAFRASGLVSVTIPIGVTSIEEGLFWDATNLVSATIPNNVTSIGSSAFWNTALTSVVIPNSVTTIRRWAFGNCTSLTSLTIGSGVTLIEGDAFANTGLTSVTIPNNVTSIGLLAFANNANLRNVTIADGTSNLALAGTGMAIGPGWTPDTLHLGRNITHSMSISPFGTNIEYLTIGESVTSIPNNAFWDNANLTTVVIPNSVTTIGTWAFGDCPNLTSVTFGSGITSIGNNAFRSTGLTSVVIPDGVTSIGISVFQDCIDLASVTMPNSVTSIGNYAFLNSGLTSLTLPANLTSIGNSAFQNNTSLTGNLILPVGLTTIGNSAFENTGFIGELIFPANLTSIGSRAFADCIGLTSLFIPNGSITIGDFAFFNNPSLVSVISPSLVPPIVQANTFLTLSPTICLYVPGESLEAYQAAIGWNLILCVEPLATFTVTFNSQGGSEVETQTVMQGDRPIMPTPPVRAGSIFEGWAVDANGTIVWNFATSIITSDTTLFAKWNVVFEGEGTSENPFTIATAEQLAQLASIVNVGDTLHSTRYYMLIADIDLSSFGVDFNSSRGWIPIGTPTNPFRGHFDGDGFMISNLFIDNGGVGGADDLGLFGVIDRGSVQNLAVVDVDITGRHRIGGIVGVLGSGSRIHACYTAGVVSNSNFIGNEIGGIVGRNYGSVENSFSTSSVTAHNSAGGIAGRSEEGSSVSNSYATGEIRGQASGGGIVGSFRFPGRIISSAALNLSSSAGRVLGTVVVDWRDAVLSNHALDVMVTTGGGVFEWELELHLRNGKNMSAQQALTASFWTTASNWYGGSGWDTDVWIIEDGKLPQLRTMRGEQPDVPEHITRHATNITDFEIQSTINVFPNPFTDIIHIAEAEGFSLQVLTQTGAVVHTQRLTTSLETVNLQHLPAGIYILRLEKDGQIRTTRVVKQ